MEDLLPLGFISINVLGVMFVLFRKRLPMFLTNLTVISTIVLDLYDASLGNFSFSSSYIFKDRVYVALVYSACCSIVFIYFLYTISGFGLKLLDRINVKVLGSDRKDSSYFKEER